MLQVSYPLLMRLVFPPPPLPENLFPTSNSSRHSSCVQQCGCWHHSCSPRLLIDTLHSIRNSLTSSSSAIHGFRSPRFVLVWQCSYKIKKNKIQKKKIIKSPLDTKNITKEAKPHNADMGLGFKKRRKSNTKSENIQSRLWTPKKLGKLTKPHNADTGFGLGLGSWFWFRQKIRKTNYKTCKTTKSYNADTGFVWVRFLFVSFRFFSLFLGWSGFLHRHGSCGHPRSLPDGPYWLDSGAVSFDTFSTSSAIPGTSVLPTYHTPPLLPILLFQVLLSPPWRWPPYPSHTITTLLLLSSTAFMCPSLPRHHSFIPPDVFPLAVGQ